MKKNAFTLVELMAIIVIMASILLIILPAINGTIKNSEEKKKQDALNSIYMAAENYVMANYDEYSSLDDIGSVEYVYITDLISNNYLSIDTVNPNNDLAFNSKDAVKVTKKQDGTFSYELIVAQTIYDVVINNFPYLEVGENGCKNPGDNNYSYMGGCYLKSGSNESGKVIFYLFMNSIGLGLDNEMITKTFFDNNGNFLKEKFEQWYKNFAIENGVTEEELNQKLEENNVDTFFELLFKSMYGVALTPEELFFQLNNSLWYSGFLWRIMGINADGSIRIITDQDVTTIPWGSEDMAENWDESHAKEWLNDYFYSKLKGNNIIKEEIWCSEITTDQNSVRTECTTNLSTAPAYVGLITLDEYNLAGGALSYLNSGQYQWTMTPENSQDSWGIGFDGVNHFPVSDPYGLRAVININSDVAITGGNGTLGEIWNNNTGPYILNEDKNIEVTGKLNEKSTSGEYVMFAGKKYRVVDKDNNGNTKLILDGYYEENGEIFKIEYGNDNAFSPATGIGQKLNTDVLNWLTNNSENEKGKLVSNYTWYQNNFDFGDSYTKSLDETNPTRSIQATVGLIRIGEMSSIQTNNYIYLNIYNWINEGEMFGSWIITSNIDNTRSWLISEFGVAGGGVVSNENRIRPVIVIKSDVEIISGTGTFSNPYQI